MQLPLSFQMPINHTSKPVKAIDIKISTVVAVQALLRQSDPALLRAAMQEMTGGEADYFDNEFAILDLSGLSGDGHQIDWPVMLALFKSYRLHPVAVRNAPAEMEAAILAQGLSLDVVVTPRRSTPEDATTPAQAEQVEAAPAPVAVAEVVAPASSSAAAPVARHTMIVDTPVRAGQRIYARDADLIVTACVNNGAEIIADGSIHIYAPLRGRALAGASGHADARIFTLSMEAELVSIAGIYRTFEDDLPAELRAHPAQIRLSGNRIDVKALHASMSKT
jgi:septum site-determining protein MinC